MMIKDEREREFARNNKLPRATYGQREKWKTKRKWSARLDKLHRRDTKRQVRIK